MGAYNRTYYLALWQAKFYPTKATSSAGVDVYFGAEVDNAEVDEGCQSRSAEVDYPHLLRLFYFCGRHILKRSAGEKVRSDYFSSFIKYNAF